MKKMFIDEAHSWIFTWHYACEVGYDEGLTFSMLPLLFFYLLIYECVCEHTHMLTHHDGHAEVTGHL